MMTGMLFHLYHGSSSEFSATSTSNPFTADLERSHFSKAIASGADLFFVKFRFCFQNRSFHRQAGAGLARISHQKGWGSRFAVYVVSTLHNPRRRTP